MKINIYHKSNHELVATIYDNYIALHDKERYFIDEEDDEIIKEKATGSMVLALMGDEIMTKNNLFEIRSE